MQSLQEYRLGVGFESVLKNRTIKIHNRNYSRVTYFSVKVICDSNSNDNSLDLIIKTIFYVL